MIGNKDKLKRNHQLVFMLNDLEYEALEKYCKKYKVKNRSKLIREALMTEILVQFDRDYPSLFDSPDYIERNDF